MVLGSAEELPFPGEAFTAVSMSIVFFFFDDPVRVLRECRRVLREGGRLAVYTTSEELRGTGAAPEPIASRGHFYTDEELAALAEQAGFHDTHVKSGGGGQLLSAAAYALSDRARRRTSAAHHDARIDSGGDLHR